MTTWGFFFSSRRRHTRFKCDWSSDVCSSDHRTPWSRSRAARATRRATWLPQLSIWFAATSPKRCYPRWKARRKRTSARSSAKNCRRAWWPLLRRERDYVRRKIAPLFQADRRRLRRRPVAAQSGLAVHHRFHHRRSSLQARIRGGRLGPARARTQPERHRGYKPCAALLPGLRRDRADDDRALAGRLLPWPEQAPAQA